MPRMILIAEDDDSTREALTRHAIRKGFEVIAVTNGVHLLQVASAVKFDLVITDLLMPDLNGASAAEIMKFQGDATPIIALTGLSPQDISLVKDKFTAIFTKPIDIGEFFKHIESLLP